MRRKFSLRDSATHVCLSDRQVDLRHKHLDTMGVGGVSVGGEEVYKCTIRWRMQTAGLAGAKRTKHKAVCAHIWTQIVRRFGGLDDEKVNCSRIQQVKKLTR